jgi:protein gp37
MGTRIPWADETWNPMTGCTPVSEACVNCYAERMARRFNLRDLAPGERVSISNYFAPRFHPSRLDKPLHWRKPRRIFVCSMSDLFHEAFTDEQIAAVFTTICKSGHATNWAHTWLILTKRPERMAEWFGWARRAHVGWFRQGDGKLDLGNVVGMVTVENQKRADERIPHLLRCPFPLYGVSLEPMLGTVDFEPWLLPWHEETELNPEHAPGCDGSCSVGCPIAVPYDVQVQDPPLLDWVILGGENGPGARPMQPEWALDVYRQCKAAGVPFFWKGGGSAHPRSVSLWLTEEAELCEMQRTQEFPARQPREEDHA